jgi:hypothetical protein
MNMVAWRPHPVIEGNKPPYKSVKGRKDLRDTMWPRGQKWLQLVGKAVAVFGERATSPMLHVIQASPIVEVANAN